MIMPCGQNGVLLGSQHLFVAQQEALENVAYVDLCHLSLETCNPLAGAQGDAPCCHTWED